LRDQSEHVENPAPELRIATDDLWQRVQARHAEKHAASGSGRSAAYACATRVNGGASACGNTIRVPRRVAESRLLAGLRNELTAPERFEQFTQEVQRLLDAERNSLCDQDRERVSRLAQLDTEIGNLTDAIASGSLRSSPALATRLHGAESERATLAARTDARTGKIADFLPSLAADYGRLVADLETALQRDVDRARHNLRALLGPVRLMPDATGQFLVAEGQVDTAQLLAVAGPLVRKCGSGGALFDWKKTSSRSNCGRRSLSPAARTKLELPSNKKLGTNVCVKTREFPGCVGWADTARRTIVV
jgi:hypothetical protein